MKEEKPTASDGDVLGVGAVVFSPRQMPAVADAQLISDAGHVVQPDLTGSWVLCKENCSGVTVNAIMPCFVMKCNLMQKQLMRLSKVACRNDIRCNDL